MDDLIRREPIEHPAEPGGFNGDIWYGHPEYRTLGTHRWDGKVWLVLPDVSDTLCLLLAKARNRIEELEASIRWVDEVYPARIEELDAKLATIDMDVLRRVEAGYSKALTEAESWIHDQLDGTGHVEDALADLDESRSALTGLRAMMEKLK